MIGDLGPHLDGSVHYGDGDRSRACVARRAAAGLSCRHPTDLVQLRADKPSIVSQAVVAECLQRRQSGVSVLILRRGAEDDYAWTDRLKKRIDGKKSMSEAPAVVREH